ncbi:RNA polymerase sigma-70 factor [Echinicola soli]|uniref:RNA polymerase sigma-70 factor n=1 Tax=Echinicola soli TaxID=2591634 RepID=A0A514CNL7_9BACT|nr:RNA polymerase sigma-70 factor [Echinicola soli]QDH81314.1 RNA polymerase sigma-70 factor [Echinicola soli]
MDDNKAITLMKNNDPSGLQYLFDKYYASLCDFAFLYLRSSDAAEDLVSDFFIKFWKQQEKISIERSVRAFMFKSVKNASLNSLRGKNRELLHFEECNEVLVSTDLSPQEQIEFKEFQDELESFTQSLPDRRKLILTLKIRAGLSNQEIATALMIAESTVKNQLSVAMSSLRDKFKIKQ